MRGWKSALYSQAAKLEEMLAAHEANRQVLVRNMFLALLGGLAVCGIVLLLIMKYYPYNKILPYIPFIGAIFSVFGPVLNAIEKNKRIYKSNVVPLLAQTLIDHIRVSETDEVHYQEKYDADISIYKTNPLFDFGNKINSEDLFYGQLGKTKFSFYETTYKYESGSGKHKHVEVQFKGLAFIADFNKNFDGLTTISVGKPKGLSLFDSFNDLQKVTLEAGEFSQKFDVYSTNSQEARYIISPAFMERIMLLSKATSKMRDKHVSILFRNSCMEVYMPNSDDHFDPSLLWETKVADVNKDFETMEQLLSLINVMQLETRIWTKE